MTDMDYTITTSRSSFMLFMLLTEYSAQRNPFPLGACGNFTLNFSFNSQLSCSCTWSGLFLTTFGDTLCCVDLGCQELKL